MVSGSWQIVEAEAGQQQCCAISALWFCLHPLPLPDARLVPPCPPRSMFVLYCPLSPVAPCLLVVLPYPTPSLLCHTPLISVCRVSFANMPDSALSIVLALPKPSCALPPHPSNPSCLALPCPVGRLIFFHFCRKRQKASRRNKDSR